MDKAEVTIRDAFQTLRKSVTTKQNSEGEWQTEAMHAGLDLLETFLRDFHAIAEFCRDAKPRD